jgi:hypothetical protein
MPQDLKDSKDPKDLKDRKQDPKEDRKDPKVTARPALQDACRRLEALLGESPAYRKIEDGLYCVKQGSSLVMLSVHPWGERAVVRLTAQLVKGVTMEIPLALQLLETNALLRFGAFAYVPAGEVVIFAHTLLDGDLRDHDEFLNTIRDFALVADDYDDRIAARYGGQTMQDLLEQGVVEHLRRGRTKADADDSLEWGQSTVDR